MSSAYLGRCESCSLECISQRPDGLVNLNRIVAYGNPQPTSKSIIISIQPRNEVAGDFKYDGQSEPGSGSDRVFETYLGLRLSNIVTNEPERSSSSVMLVRRVASSAVIAPQFIALRK